MSKDNTIFVQVDYEDEYMQPLIIAALKAKLASPVWLEGSARLPDGNAKVLQWRQYESIDFDRMMQSSTTLANSYIIRKALIRKHYLANTVTHWLSKNPGSDLKNHIQQGVEFEVDYAEFLDDALLEAYELHESWARNEGLDDKSKEWWILKPGMSDRGQGIRLFSTEAELTSIFEEWDPQSDDEDEAQHSDEGNPAHINDITTSQLRHFIAQPYIHPPLLLSSPHPSADRKFHVRTYVLAVGALKVYVYKPMLALFAEQVYCAPNSETSQLNAHLTNTCLQDSGKRQGAVHAFWSLPSSLESLPASIRDHWQQHVWKEICQTTSTIFEAAAKVSSIHFQALPNAFEIFGLDYLIDARGCAYLLEVNAFPDFAQTGPELHGIIRGLIEGVVDKAVLPFFGLECQEPSSDLVQVLDLDLGRR